MQRQIDSQTGICHFRSPETHELNEYFSLADFSPLEIDRSILNTSLNTWLDYGCIYVDGKRVRTHCTVPANSLLRLHTRPKRFACPSDEVLTRRIVYSDDELLVIDKPAGLPTHPTLDNFLENAKTAYERALGIPLYTTHRLDVPTQGLLVFAKTSGTQRRINSLLSRGLIQKKYHAYSIHPLQPNVFEHFMNYESRVPKQMSDRPVDDAWISCRLEVLSADRFSDLQENYWRHSVRLITGRTHQIRAQFAFMGAPLVGDTAYGGPSDLSKSMAEKFTGGIGLECMNLAFRLRGQDFEFQKPEIIKP
jgi:23S rRNA pseudouridine1911/1915/1917 synthase